MVIENKVNGIIRLFADEGKKITNSERSFFTDFIYLGKNDSIDNYEEVGREIWKHFIEEENPDIIELTARTEDLQNDINNLNEMQDANLKTDDMLMSAIADSFESHEVMMDVMLCAIDEMYQLIAPVMETDEEICVTMGLDTDRLNKIKNNNNIFGNLYVIMVKRGLKKIEDIPNKYKNYVANLLA